MDIIPKVWRAGVVLALIALVLALGALPAMTRTSAIPAQPPAAQAIAGGGAAEVQAIKVSGR